MYYLIQVHSQETPCDWMWRYRNFRALDKELRPQFPDLPPLPPKSTFRKRLVASFLRSREQGLADLLVAAVHRDPDLSSTALREFLLPQAWRRWPSNSDV